MYLFERVPKKPRYRRSIKTILKHWGRKTPPFNFKMQTELSCYFDVNHIIMEPEIVDFIRNTKIEAR